MQLSPASTLIEGKARSKIRTPKALTDDPYNPGMHLLDWIYMSDDFFRTNYCKEWRYVAHTHCFTALMSCKSGGPFRMVLTMWYGSATTPIKLCGPSRYQWDQGYFQQKLYRRVSNTLAEKSYFFGFA